MVFKRRNRRSLLAFLRESVYPKGGFLRAIRYVAHRMRRIPDEPHRIARGVMVGVFVNFPPLFGVQFLSAALLAWAVRGNIIAALLCTFLSNPVTTPFIAIGSLELGYWMLGIDARLDFLSVVAAFSNAGLEIWSNVKAMFTAEHTEWGNLRLFFGHIFLPYFVGSLLPGVIVSAIAYYITIPLSRAYQQIRSGKLKERLERHRLAKAAKQAAEPRDAVTRGDDAGGGKP